MNTVTIPLNWSCKHTWRRSAKNTGWCVESIDQEADFHLQPTDHHPGVERLIESRAVKCHADQRHGRQNKGQQHPQNGQRMRHAPTDPVTSELGSKDAGQDSAHQRRHWDRQ